MDSYDVMLKAFRIPRIFTRILINLNDIDIINLNKSSKGINKAIKRLEHYEKVESQEVTIYIEHASEKGYTCKIIPDYINVSNVTKINFNFLGHGSEIEYGNIVEEYKSILGKMLGDVNLLLSKCDNDLQIKIQAFYPFVIKFLVPFFGSLTYYGKVKIELFLKPYCNDMQPINPRFDCPDYSMLQGFKNIELIVIRSNFDKESEFLKYFIACLPDSESLRVNFDFVGYLTKEQWKNFGGVMDFTRLNKFKMGLCCWGEDGAFWRYIPHAFTTEYLKRIHRFEVHGDSFDILRKFHSFLSSLENLRSLICNFHLYEHVTSQRDVFLTFNVDRMSVCHGLKKLTNLTSVACNFNYLCDSRKENVKNLMVIDRAFNNLLDSLPPSVSRLSINGLRALDLNMAKKIHTLLPNLIYLNISKINNLDEDILNEMANVRFIVLHACQLIKIPKKILVCAIVCCPERVYSESTSFFKTYWRYCNCMENHSAWAKVNGKLKKYRKVLERTTDYYINVFYNGITDGWNVLKVFSDEYVDNIYRDSYFRRRECIM
uniref:F-box domain-containing protein n=1 Tax=Strongyloides venezuelensis TaxID=75913 RepID=A0A0K0FU06_STRVS